MRKLSIMFDDGKVDMSTIEEFEKDIGFCLPMNYKKLISEHNGLDPVEECYEFINVYGDKYEGAIVFISFGNDTIKDSMYISQRISDPVYYGIPNLVAFGDFGNGDVICFDYRDDPKTCNPKVVHVYHDDYTENEDGTFSMTVNFVANSFEEFIDMLYEDDE